MCVTISTSTSFLHHPHSVSFQVVRVKDRTLGLIRLSFMLLIAVYIVVKVLILDKGYNSHDIPIGAVRTSLKKDPDDVRYSAPSSLSCSLFV